MVDSASNARSNFAVMPSAPNAMTSTVSTVPVVVAVSPVAVPIVPSGVSTASAIQKLISGVLIFLLGLALRNMLKVK